MLSTEQRQQFVDEGFVAIDRLVGDDVIADLRVAYDEILRGDVDCGGDDRQLGGVTRQVMNARRHHKGLHDSPAFEAARTASSELLGCDRAQFTFDMMIFKPPQHLVETPWHQDMAYLNQPVAPAGLPLANISTQVWLALDDVDEETGCMHFIPRVHRNPLLAHVVASGDPTDQGRLLAVADEAMSELDVEGAVACPLKAGGCTIHSEGTPHYTTPNVSTDRPRRAYIMNFMKI